MHPVVDTSHGRVRGTSHGSINSFKGIPYGASTTGDRRFRPPAPVTPWVGELDATGYGCSAPQLASEHSVQTNPWQRWATAQVAAAIVPPKRTVQPQQGEDCLVLNIFTPGLHDARRPVMLWLHGGAWVMGSGSEPWFDGTNLAHRGDVVVVTVNHRLGLLGYLNLAAHAADDYPESGSAGVLDLVAALRWIRDNIAAFGGDPGNVTIFGQSGGGEKVAALLGTPASAGLFHKAVMQSSLGARSFASQAFSQQLADELIHELGIRQVNELRNIPVQRLLETQLILMQRAYARALATTATTVRPQFHEGMIFSPVLPAGVDSATDMAASSPTVPLLIGTVADETALTPPALSLPRLQALDQMKKGALEHVLEHVLEPVLGPQTTPIVSAYRSIRPDLDAARLMTAITTDHGFRIPGIRFAQLRSAAVTAPTYAYLLNGRVSVNGTHAAAPHCIDIPLVFDNLDSSPFWPADAAGPGIRQQLAATVSDAWIAFARCGTPVHAGLPDWPLYAASHRATMLLSDTSRVVVDPKSRERQIWEKFTDDQFALTGELTSALTRQDVI